MTFEAGTKFEVGQVWADTRAPGMEYKVYEIESQESYYGGRYFVARTHNYHEGCFIQNGFFYGNANCEPSTLNEHWYLVSDHKEKTFSRINRRTLRKRERDQVAARALTHRLTSQSDGSSTE